MQFDITYNFDLSVIENLTQRVTEELNDRGSNTAKAVERATDLVKETWIRLAQDRLKKSTGGYVNAIAEGVYYPFADNLLYKVIENKHKAALLLEYGYPAFDMKIALQRNTNGKVRVSKQGKKYLIIPFQHGTPNKGGGERATLQTMPEEIYAKAKLLSPTIKHRVHTGGGDAIKTKWGTRLRADNTGDWGRRTKVYSFGNALALSPLSEVRNPEYSEKFSGAYTWKSSPYKGMLKMQTNKGSIYMTFRVMSEDSEGWIHPRQPALNIAADTVQQTREAVLQILGDGVKQDVQLIMTKLNRPVT